MSKLQDDIRELKQKVELVRTGLENRLRDRISDVVSQFSTEHGIAIQEIRVDLATVSTLGESNKITIVKGVNVAFDD